MLHGFFLYKKAHIKHGATGRVITGYETKIIDADGNEVPTNQPERLAVSGITGCK